MLEVVQYMIATKSKIESRNSDGQTALSANFDIIFDPLSRRFQRNYHPHTRRVVGPTWRACVPDADWCLPSDLVPDSTPSGCWRAVQATPTWSDTCSSVNRSPPRHDLDRLFRWKPVPARSLPPSTNDDTAVRETVVYITLLGIPC